MTTCGATLWRDTNNWDAMLRTPASFLLHHVHVDVSDEHRTTPRLTGSRSQSLVLPLPRLRRPHSKAPLVDNILVVSVLMGNVLVGNVLVGNVLVGNVLMGEYLG